MTTKLTLLTIAALAAFGAAPAAQAAGELGWYGSINAGRSDQKVGSGAIDAALANQGVPGSSTIEDHDTGYSLEAGYRLNSNFALEGSYVDLGKFDFRSTVSGTFKASGVGLEAVGIIPIENRFALYGKAGAFSAKSELSASAPASGRSKRETVPTFGLGASYDFGDNVVGKLEWNRYQNLGDASTGEGDVDLYTMGVGYKF